MLCMLSSPYKVRAVPELDRKNEACYRQPCVHRLDTLVTNVHEELKVGLPAVEEMQA